MRILVFGGSGQLGITFSNLALSKGHDVLCSNSKILDFNSDFKLKIENYPKVDFVLNCAAWTNVGLSTENYEKADNINNHALQHLIEFAQTLNIPLIHISTDYVFSGKIERPWKETDIASPINDYGKTKFQGEQLIANTYPENSYIIRTAWLYSEYGTNFIFKILEKYYRSEDIIKVVSDQFGQPTNAYDLSKAILEIMTLRPTTGIYHITNAGKASWFDFAKSIIELSGGDIKRVIPVRSKDFIDQIIRPKNTVLDNSKMIINGLTPLPEWQFSLNRFMGKLTLGKYET